MRTFWIISLVVGFFSVSLPALAQSPASGPPYSDAVEAGGVLYVSGQIGRANGQLVTESFAAEAHQVMRNIGDILQKRKLTHDDLVSVTIYLKDMKHYAAMNEVYRTYFRGNRLPARVCIAVADLPFNANVEIAGIAKVKE
ncbi:RidA family protein [Rudanella paleaurantiibacter]|uniref:RidA family protein n=1 Tax=Rudanella paleaurantiibacter TaxID=2614655 RepID=A0A7J5U603_9BACT|nr:RidA family protein [Rudanella paleaurantiibacter]KAB7733113.1 RidA family protein [Rudanella paleaurantiibacter]